MDARKLQSIYIRLLYCDDFSSLEPSEELDFIMSNVSVCRLEVERNARVRNLRTVLYSDMRILNQYVCKSKLLGVVQGYCGSKSFWEHRGRTLLEDFCLFYAQQNEIHPRLRLLSEVEGTLSGHSVAQNRPSPWGSHQKTLDGDEEYFFAAWWARPKDLMSGALLEKAAISCRSSKWRFIKDKASLKLKVEICS